MQAYRLIRTSQSIDEGSIFYAAAPGLTTIGEEDTARTGDKHLALTMNEDGTGPFISFHAADVELHGERVDPDAGDEPEPEPAKPPVVKRVKAPAAKKPAPKRKAK